MDGWNFADVWEVVADTLPDAPAQVQGDRTVTWSQMDRRADGIAQALIDAGFQRQDKVAHYLYNCPEYLESTFGIMKAAMVPVNTNYRYGPEEIVYLWDNADAVAVIFHGTFTSTIEGIRDRVPGVKLWLWVDDGTGPCPEWATPYEQAAAAASGRVVPSWGRSGDDLWMLYTGGTTGMPKGVMWRQGDLGGGNTGSLDVQATKERLQAATPGVHLPACPLMHGTGALTSFLAMHGGACIVSLVSRSFDAGELLEAVQTHKVRTMAIVGDAFAKPILQSLDANPGRWDITSLQSITSSGVMWSEPVKKGLLAHHPNMMLTDAFSSSEALGMGTSMSTGSNVSQTAKFMVGGNTRVVTEDGRDVQPGSEEIGLVAVKGLVPVGYYKDPDKSAATFKVIDGERYSIPGDWAMVEADGSLKILGRGSVCINTGGEKVFPEEVEEAIKEHPAVRDAAVVGVPDEKWGEAITALVELAEGASVEEPEIVAHVKGRLAAYKAPKRVLITPSIGRSPAGKVDYPRLKREATDRSAANA